MTETETVVSPDTRSMVVSVRMPVDAFGVYVTDNCDNRPASSLVTLTIFALVNLALFALKRRDPRPADHFTVPILVPLLGFLASAAFLVFELLRQLQTAG